MLQPPLFNAIRRELTGDLIMLFLKPAVRLSDTRREEPGRRPRPSPRGRTQIQREKRISEGQALTFKQMRLQPPTVGLKGVTRDGSFSNPKRGLLHPGEAACPPQSL